MTLASQDSSSWRRVVLATRRRHPMALRGLELVMGALFLYLGGTKLLGTPAAVRLFRDIGWGQWFRYVTGVVEVTGALLLLIPALAGASALLLMSVMVAACSRWTTGSWCISTSSSLLAPRRLARPWVPPRSIDNACYDM